jgi:DNA mismatch repair protein MutS
MKPNDVNITTLCNLQLLFGPNSSGKSTYLRQIGLLCILAQAGFWVPAKAMCIHPFSHIFTRMSMQEKIRAHSSSLMLEAQVGTAPFAVNSIQSEATL